MEEVEREFEGRRLGSARRRNGASEPMETRSGRKNPSEWPAREKSGRPSWRPKNCDTGSHEDCQTGNGLKNGLNHFLTRKGGGGRNGKCAGLLFCSIDFVDWKRTDQRREMS